jgi:hypothetical protein
MQSFFQQWHVMRCFMLCALLVFDADARLRISRSRARSSSSRSYELSMVILEINNAVKKRLDIAGKHLANWLSNRVFGSGTQSLLPLLAPESLPCSPSPDSIARSHTPSITRSLAPTSQTPRRLDRLLARLLTTSPPPPQPPPGSLIARLLARPPRGGMGGGGRGEREKGPGENT